MLPGSLGENLAGPEIQFLFPHVQLVPVV